MSAQEVMGWKPPEKVRKGGKEDQQLVVKSLVDELMRVRRRSTGGEPTPWYGSLEHLGIYLTEEDIAEARHEMWGNFPREVGP